MCKLVRIALAIVLCSQSVSMVAWGDEQVDVRLRLTWGGGARRLWDGMIYVQGGQCTDPHALGIDADAPTILQANSGQIRFWQRTPATFDGIDLQVVADRDATLVVEMQPDRLTEARKRLEIPIDKLTTVRGFLFSSQLDTQENRLIARRVPGDHLRLDFNRDSLVFSPGEPFTFRLMPRLLGFEENTALKCEMHLHRSGEEKDLWSHKVDLRADAEGNTEPLDPLEVTMPDQEGVYEITIALTQRRFAEALVNPRLILQPRSPAFQRSLQFVVIDPNPHPANTANWRQVHIIDLTSREWWEKWVVPQLNLLPGIDKMARGPLGSGPLVDLGDHRTQIGGGNWHAVPIPISDVGKPHLLEIEYASDLRQTIGISVVEPDAAGNVTTIGLDSGVDVEVLDHTDEAHVEKHRLLFWPRTETPWLVLTNRRDEAAVIGTIKVFAGPESLPPAPIPLDSKSSRLVAAYYDKPFFPENFCAAQALDVESNRSLDDWHTFHQGGERLCEYLKYVGYNAAVISVVRDGGALYPSQLLVTTPKYDNGSLFVTGQDPIKKDVLEMLFRQFDRERLTLVPAVRFSFPLMDLESLVLSGKPGVEGLELVGERGATGSPIRGWELGHRGSAPYYNPLDVRVQNAVRKVMLEIANRYAHHPSFGGVCLQLGADTYVQLPYEAAPLDLATIGRFQAETNTRIPSEGNATFGGRCQYLRGAGRREWLRWRSQELARFYETIGKDLNGVRGDSRLYLAMSQLLVAAPSQQALHPRLLAQSDISSALLQYGIDTHLYHKQSTVVPIRPQRQAPPLSLASQAVNIALSRSSRADESFRGAEYSAAMNFHEPLKLRLPEFDKQSPFGTERTHLWLASHIAPSGANNRSRFVHYLATMDAQFLADGGWMLLMGQEDSLRPVFEVFRQLPAASFKTWEPRSSSGRGADVVVRSLAHGGQTYLYVVNDSPWATVVNLEIQTPPHCALRSLSTRPLPQWTKRGGGSNWTLELEPYDLVGAVLQTPKLEIRDWQVTYQEDVVAELNQRIKDVRARVNALAHPSLYRVLENPGFERPRQETTVTGWIYSQREGVTVEVESSDAKVGRQCLHLKVDEPGKTAWVRSKSFKPPRSGRISVMAWIRTRDATRQPPLRLSIDGDRQCYRFAPLGVDVDRNGKPTGDPAVAVPTDWAKGPFLLTIDDLPMDLNELLVGFDLIGEGEVWIDDVQIYDLYFQQNEKDELLKKVGIAGHHLGEGRISDCARHLYGYWPRFLMENVSVPTTRVAAVPETTPERIETPATDDHPQEADAGERTGWRRFVPPLKLPFR